MRVQALCRPAVTGLVFGLALAGLCGSAGCAGRAYLDSAMQRGGGEDPPTGADAKPIDICKVYHVDRVGNDGYGHPVGRDTNLIEGMTDSHGRFVADLTNSTGVIVTGLVVELYEDSDARAGIEDPDTHIGLDRMLINGGAPGSAKYDETRRHQELLAWGPATVLVKGGQIQLVLRFVIRGKDDEYWKDLTKPTPIKVRLWWLAGEGTDDNDDPGVPV